jgi:hypothetical protein
MDFITRVGKCEVLTVVTLLIGASNAMKMRESCLRAGPSTGRLAGIFAVGFLLAGCSPALSPQFASEEEAKWAKKVCKDEKVVPESEYLVELSSAALTQRDRFQRGITMAGDGLSGHPGQSAEGETHHAGAGEDAVAQPWSLRPQSGDFLVLETSSDPYAQPFISVEIVKNSGTERLRVHPCELIARSFVRSKNGDDLQFSIRRIEDGHSLKSIVVEGDTIRGGGARSCRVPGERAMALTEGQTVRIAAVAGEVRLGGMAGTHGPLGMAAGYRDYNYPEFRNFNHGALLSELNGEVQGAQKGTTLQAGQGGCLSFFLNDTDVSNNRGRFHLLLEVW